ncbi:hypothetical protein DNK56_25355 [Streptomyces sp. AC1-42W]|nr:hypothetical protein DNK56_25355 [Streptomyces sp. AC1-42W]PZT79410.1 hypothetical protein DNK55_07325 [Streptomyces sp. AC1-42T]
MSVTLPSGILHPDVSGVPEPASTNDGNRWTWGPCWGWCLRERARVLWLGPAQTTGHVVADLYYCGPCIERLHARIVAHARDAVPTRTVTTEGLPIRSGPRHKAPRRLFR